MGSVGALLLLCAAVCVSGFTEINFVYADLLRGSRQCVGCSSPNTCPLLPSPAANGSVPISGPVCVRGSAPCSGGAALVPVGNTLCLSGASSPFGAVLDVAIQCGANGTSSVWALCAGSQNAGCGNCRCTCRADAALTAYANRMAFNLTTTGFCYDNWVLPQSINPLNLLLSCAAC